MLRPVYRYLLLPTLLFGLALRAVTPLGYMPASAGSGLLFELCPDQLPPGYVLPGADSSAHEHHHHHNDGDSLQAAAGADLCQFGHLLFSAMPTDDGDGIVSATAITQQPILPIVVATPGTVPSAYRSRAPPA